MAWNSLPYGIRSCHDVVIKWKHFPRYWPFMRGIHRSPVNSPHKGQWRGALMFSLISDWINDWVNNREAGDLRRYRTHYDVIVMKSLDSLKAKLKTYLFMRHIISQSVLYLLQWITSCLLNDFTRLLKFICLISIYTDFTDQFNYFFTFLLVYCMCFLIYLVDVYLFFSFHRCTLFLPWFYILIMGCLRDVPMYVLERYMNRNIIIYYHYTSVLMINVRYLLTNWGRQKMAVILPSFSNSFSWIIWELLASKWRHTIIWSNNGWTLICNRTHTSSGIESPSNPLKTNKRLPSN